MFAKDKRKQNKMGLPLEYQEIPEYFDKHNISADTDIKNAAIEKLLRQHKANHVLDMTCGTGSQVFYLLKHGYQVTGSDFSPDLLCLARKKAEAENIEVEFIDGDMRFLKVGAFAAVITMFNAIGHLSKQDFAIALQNIAKNLVKDGIYIFDIFNFQALTEEVLLNFNMDLEFRVKQDKIRQFQHSELDRDNKILTSHDKYIIEDQLGNIREISNSFSLQIYEFHELKNILHKNGFRVCNIYDIYGTEFRENKSLNILVVAQVIS